MAAAIGNFAIDGVTLTEQPSRRVRPGADLDDHVSARDDVPSEPLRRPGHGEAGVRLAPLARLDELVVPVLAALRLGLAALGHAAHPLLLLAQYLCEAGAS